MGLRLMEVAWVAVGHVDFSSQGSWAELKAVQKKEQPLKKKMQRKGGGSER